MGLDLSPYHVFGVYVFRNDTPMQIAQSRSPTNLTPSQTAPGTPSSAHLLVSGQGDVFYAAVSHATEAPDETAQRPSNLTGQRMASAQKQPSSPPLVTKVVFHRNDILDRLDGLLNALNHEKLIQVQLDDIFSQNKKVLTSYGSWVEFDADEHATVGATLSQGVNVIILVLSDRGCPIIKNRASKLMKTLDSELRDTTQRVPSYRDLNKCSERCTDYIRLHIELEFRYAEVHPHHHIALTNQHSLESDRPLSMISDLADKLRLLGIWPKDSFWPTSSDMSPQLHSSGSWRLQNTQQAPTLQIQYNLSDYALALRTEYFSRERDPSSIWNMPIYEMAVSIGREDSIPDVVSFLRLCLNKGLVQTVKKLKNTDIFTLTLKGYNILSVRDKASFWRKKSEQWKLGRVVDFSPLLKAMMSVNTVELVQKLLKRSSLSDIFADSLFAKCLACMLEDGIIKQVFLVPRLNNGLVNRDLALSNLDEATTERINTIRKYVNQDFTLEEIVSLIHHKEKMTSIDFNQVVQDLLALDQSISWFTIDEEGTVRRESGVFQYPSPCEFL